MIEELDTGAAAYRLSTGTNGGSLTATIGEEAHENLRAMHQNIAMLTNWVAQSGQGMVVQGDEVFAPSSPDGGYCDVFVDKEAAGIFLMAFVIAVEVFQPSPSMARIDSLILKLLGEVRNRRGSLPMAVYVALMYDYLYTLSRQIALSCIG